MMQPEKMKIKQLLKIAADVDHKDQHFALDELWLRRGEKYVIVSERGWDIGLPNRLKEKYLIPNMPKGD